MRTVEQTELGRLGSVERMKGLPIILAVVVPLLVVALLLTSSKEASAESAADEQYGEASSASASAPSATASVTATVGASASASTSASASASASASVAEDKHTEASSPAIPTAPANDSGSDPIHPDQTSPLEGVPVDDVRQTLVEVLNAFASQSVPGVGLSGCTPGRDYGGLAGPGCFDGPDSTDIQGTGPKACDAIGSYGGLALPEECQTDPGFTTNFMGMLDSASLLLGNASPASAATHLASGIMSTLNSQATIHDSAEYKNNDGNDDNGDGRDHDVSTSDAWGDE